MISRRESCKRKSRGKERKREKKVDISDLRPTLCREYQLAIAEREYNRRELEIYLLKKKQGIIICIYHCRFCEPLIVKNVKNHENINNLHCFNKPLVFSYAIFVINNIFLETSCLQCLHWIQPLININQTQVYVIH